MKGCLLLLVASLFLVGPPLRAQETMSTTRIERQHNFSHFQKEHMLQTEESLLDAITSKSVGLQQTAIQTMRELEQLDTSYPFSSLIAPLVVKLKDEKADKVVRTLSALALDELHSDAGDQAIKTIADNGPDKDLQTLCAALLVRSNLE